MKNWKQFNESSIIDQYSDLSIIKDQDNDLKREIEIEDIKIGDKIKFMKSTSLFRRFAPSIKGTVAGTSVEHEIFFKDEIYEFSNFWSDFTSDGYFGYDKTLAMEFECLESPKKGRVGNKLVLSLGNFRKYKKGDIFENYK